MICVTIKIIPGYTTIEKSTEINFVVTSNFQHASTKHKHLQLPGLQSKLSAKQIHQIKERIKSTQGISPYYILAN